MIAKIKKMSKNKSQIAFRIESSKIDRFKERAKEEGKSQTAIIDQLITNYLNGTEPEPEVEQKETVKKSQIEELERRLSHLEECFFSESNITAEDIKAVEEKYGFDREEKKKLLEEEEDIKAVEALEAKYSFGKKEAEEVVEAGAEAEEVVVEEGQEEEEEEEEEEEVVEEEGQEEEEEDKYEKPGDWFPDNELFRMVIEKSDEPDIEILWGKHVNHFHNICHFNRDDGYLADTGLVNNHEETADAFCFPPTKEMIEKKRKRNEGHGVDPELIVERIKGLESVEMLFELLGEGQSEFSYRGDTDPEKVKIIKDLEKGYWYDKEIERFFRYNNETDVGMLKNPAPIVRGKKYRT